MEPPNEKTKPLSSKPSNTTMETHKKDHDYPSKERDGNHQNRRNPYLKLDLRLSSNDSDKEIDSQLDLNDIFNVENPQYSDKTPQGNELEPRVFSCNYCQRKFYSSQALGGHQNAHKRERTLAKRGQRISSTSSFGNFYPHHFYKGSSSRLSPSSSSSSSLLSFPNPNPNPNPNPSNIASLPLYGSCNKSNYNTNHRPLGIQAHSLIHKPSSSYMTFSRMPMIDQQPAIGRLSSVASPSSSSSNGGARFDSNVQRNSQPLDRSINGGVCWKSSVNVLKGTSHKQDHDQLLKLDLSLKL